MGWIELITVLAVLQLFVFSVLVARARGRYGVHAPATSGHEMFDRYYRVQMNTVEVLMLFLPSLWVAAMCSDSVWITIGGFVYLVGRIIYAYGYVSDPKKRGLGYVLSILPTLGLMGLALVCSIQTLLA
jgi:glutathione S-transferase